MLGTLGTPEMIFIFLLALILFGPKKLPEIGRTVGKALTEFRRASSELKSTFDREIRSLEAETKSLSTETNPYQYDTYNYDYASYDNTYDESYNAEHNDSNAANPSTISASATEGAESPSAIEGTIARESQPAEPNGSHEHAAPQGEPPVEGAVSSPAEHNA